MDHATLHTSGQLAAGAALASFRPEGPAVLPEVGMRDGFDDDADCTHCYIFNIANVFEGDAGTLPQSTRFSPDCHFARQEHASQSQTVISPRSGAEK